MPFHGGSPEEIEAFERETAGAPKLDLSGLTPEEREALGHLAEGGSGADPATIAAVYRKVKLTPPPPKADEHAVTNDDKAPPKGE